MRDYLQLKRVVWGQLFALWSVSALAAQETFASDITSIPLGAIAVAMGLAFIGGLAFTTQKIAKPSADIANVPLEILKDVINSLVAGLVAFFVGSWAGWPIFGQAVIITVAGYGGSRFLESVFVDVLGRVSAFIKPGEPK